MHHLPVPLARVNESGETVSANMAFERLAERLQGPPRLIDLFGANFSRALARAWTQRTLVFPLAPVVGPEPRPVFRVSFVECEPGHLGVVLHDVSEELRAQRRVGRAEQRLAVLRDLGQALSGVVDVENITERIEAETRRALPTRNIYIALYDQATHMVTFPRYLEEGVWKEMHARSFTNGITEYLLRKSTPLMLNRDVMGQLRGLGIEPHGRPCRAWLGAPMVADGENIGVIALQNYENEDVYDDHDLELLTIIASQAAAAVKTARSLSVERRAYRDLSEAQARLLESERLRGITETVGAMNHEVNNPLAAIVGNAQLLLRSKDLGPGVEGKVTVILDAARRIQRVTGKMASLIQASTMLYPGQESIIDVRASLSSETEEQSRP